MSADPRWPDLISKTITTDTKVVIIGFPIDEGVYRNGGRRGASQAPPIIRAALEKLTPDARNPLRHIEVLHAVTDLGDIDVSGGLEAAQERLSVEVAAHQAAGRITIVLGGGHETTYGHGLGFIKQKTPFNLRNVDAHADVRPLKNGRGHSGSPFRQLFEHPQSGALSYHLAGAAPHAIAAQHADFVRQRGTITWLSILNGFAQAERAAFWQSFFRTDAPTLASFDMDAVTGASAPGVSAVNPAGISPEIWLEAAYAAGASQAVLAFDLVEFSPPYDRDQLTARLAALTVWTFTAGLASRCDDL
jgi:formiminoglutamase